MTEFTLTKRQEFQAKKALHRWLKNGKYFIINFWLPRTPHIEKPEDNYAHTSQKSSEDQSDFQKISKGNPINSLHIKSLHICG